MSKWVLVPEGITEAVDAAKDFYELYKRTVVSGCTPMEQLRFVAALKFFESMLNAAPSPDKQPVAWYVFDKRTQKHWYTNKSVNTAGYYAKEYSYREADGSPSMLVVPLYEHPPVAPAPDGAITNEGTKSDVEPVAWRWKTHNGYAYSENHYEGECGEPLYAHPPAADVQPAIYPEEAREMGLEEVPYYTHPPAADVAELVDALRRLEEVASDCDIGYMDNAVRHARVVLDKWERK
jgi:hypothetical protein